MKKFDPFIQSRCKLIDEDPYILMPQAEFGQYMWVLHYAALHLSDGFVPLSILERSFPDYEETIRVAGRLCARGLWEQVEGGYVVRNYEAVGRMRADVDSIVLARREAGRKGGLKKASTWKKNPNKSEQLLANAYQILPITHNSEPITHTEEEITTPKPHEQIVGAWMVAFEAARGCKPVVGSRNGKAAKDMLASVGLETALDCITNAFADSWFKTTSCDLYIVASQVNKYRFKASSLPGGASGMYVEGLKRW